MLPEINVAVMNYTVQREETSVCLLCGPYLL